MILIGNYGSGKTELSLNFALEAAKNGKTVLVDLDIVNPYFRSSEKTDMLEKQGVTVIAPPYAQTGVDLPVVGPEVASVFVGDYQTVVIDVGGDPVGAAALGRYYDSFALQEDLTVYFVVNVRRPLCASAEDIVALLRKIEDRSRIKVTAFINNTNLSIETTPQELIDGMKEIEKASAITGIPLAFVSGREDVLEAFEKSEKPEAALLPVKTYMRPEWLNY